MAKRPSSKETKIEKKMTLKELIFKDKKAAFIPIGKELTLKRSEVLMEQFREHGGKALNFELCKVYNIHY